MGCESMVEKIIYWKMQNGHKHSFFTNCDEWQDDDSIPSGYYFKDDREAKTQGDYFEYIKESEHTDVEILEEIEYNETGLREAIDAGYVRLRGADEPLITLAGLQGLEFI